MFFLVVIFFAGAFGGIPSSLEDIWQTYSDDQTNINMVESLGPDSSLGGIDSQQPPSSHGASYITDNIHYYLYTKPNETIYEIKKNNISLLESSSFNPLKKTKILIHGFWSDYEEPIDKTLSKAFLDYTDMNIIAVDWKKLAGALLYNKAAANTLPVGKEVAQMLDFLVTAGGANLSDIHILGHSLGAHVAAFAANYITSGRVTRITGLDPALPLFGHKASADRLDPTDADIVDCVHTCGKHLGFYEPLCTHDFYPNGGKPIQTGCGLDLGGLCSHQRSFHLYAASVAGYSFKAQACSSFQEVHKESCSGEWTGLLGEPAATTPAGLYLLQTTGSYPFSK